MQNDTDVSAQIDAILARLPAGQRTALQSLRRTIAAAAPDAVEAISYALPAFKYAADRSCRTVLPKRTWRSTA